MKFRLNGELKLWVEDLELEGNDVDDAIRKLISNPQDIVDALKNSGNLYVDGVDTSSDSIIELYEKEIDVTVSDIKWNLEEYRTEDSIKAILELPKEFTFTDLTVDNYSKDYDDTYYQNHPIDEESEDACIKDALCQHIWNKYAISIDPEEIKSFDKEITNEQ